MIRFWWPWPYFQGHFIINTQKLSFMCTLSFFLHIFINIIRNLNIVCINVHIHQLLLLQKKKGQRINTVIVIPLCSSLISVTLLFFLCILLNSFRNLVIFCMNVDIDKLLLLWKFFYFSCLSCLIILLVWWLWLYFQGHAGTLKLKFC